MQPTRRSFLTATSAAAAGGFLLSPGQSARAAESQAPEGAIVHAGYPTEDVAVVREVVAVSHGNFERVKELVTQRPELAKAGYDWGFGDWETALGAASHMGRRDIAEFLIEHGARPNLFTAAMLGQLEVVRAAVGANPGIQKQLGPHGITLLAHARFGGEAAKPVVSYLEGLGDADVGYVDEPLSETEQQALTGTYVFGDGDDQRFEIEVNSRGLLAIRRGSNFGRALFHQGEYEFHPGGAPSVRIRFALEDGRPVSFEIRSPKPILTARRI